MNKGGGGGGAGTSQKKFPFTFVVSERVGNLKYKYFKWLQKQTVDRKGGENWIEIPVRT